MHLAAQKLIIGAQATKEPKEGAQGQGSPGNALHNRVGVNKGT
jgi:hypothetical protein